VTLPADYVREHVRLGYAATEHGNQSDTQTGSLTLATPATTGRGLYVAMTRGREDNTVLVVTETHDAPEARAILEAIVASDRADVPAVAQRRELAAQDQRVPRLQPRCEIPDWYGDLRSEAVANYRQARRALDESREKREQLVDAAEHAKAKFDEANRACAPFDAERADADAALKRAENDRRTAQRQLDECGLRGRRHARAELAVAEDRVAGAQVVVVACEERCETPASKRAAARRDLERARDNVRNHDLLDGWKYLPERLATAEQTIDALDTWHDWAAGKTVEIDRLANAVANLRDGDELAGTRDLGEVTGRWAARNGYNLARSIDFEPMRIDLGIGL
jgi:hypothetical protein